MRAAVLVVGANGSGLGFARAKYLAATPVSLQGFAVE